LTEKACRKICRVVFGIDENLERAVTSLCEGQAGG